MTRTRTKRIQDYVVDVLYHPRDSRKRKRQPVLFFGGSNAAGKPMSEVAQNCFDQVCLGSVSATGHNLLLLHLHLLKLAVIRGVTRAWNQRSLIR